MSEMTDDELDEARAREAAKLSLAKLSGGLAPDDTWRINDIAKFAARLAREGWVPVDPDLVAAKDIVAKYYESKGCPMEGDLIRNGGRDGYAIVVTALAAFKAGRAVGR